MGHEKFLGMGYEKFLGMGYKKFLGMGYKKFLGMGYEKFPRNVSNPGNFRGFLGISADFPQNCYLGYILCMQYISKRPGCLSLH